MDLKIQVSADTAQATTALNGIKNQLGQVKTAIVPVETEFQKLSKQLEFTQRALPGYTSRIKELKDKLLQLTPAQNTATQAIVKTAIASKQAEDASGGFAKGLTKAYSGLRTLANIIPGVGIGGLIGLIAGPLVDAFLSLSDATEEATKDQKKFAQSLDEVRAKGISTGLELQGFVNIARDQTQSLDVRNQALKEANKIMGEHGEKLTLLNIATKAVTDEINKFTEATIQQALASKYADRAADLIIKQRDASIAYGKELDKTNELQKKYTDFQKIASAAGSGMEESLIGETQALIDQKSKLIQSATGYKEVTKELGKMKEGLFGAQAEATKLFAELGTKVKPETGKKIKEKLLKEIRFKPDDLSKLFFDEAAIKLEVPAFVELNFKKGLRDNPFKSEGLQGILGTEALSEFQMQGTLLGLGITTGIQDGVETGVKGLRFPQLKELFDDATKRAAEFAANVSGILTSGISDAFSQLGASIGDALSGATDPIGNFFGGIAAILAKSLKDLGKYVIESSTLIASLKKALNAAFAGNPILGIVAGVALIAIGTALENALPKFAQGVTNFSGGLAVVGERGPELVRLPSGSDVIPNHQLGGIGASSSVFIPDIRIRGNDLLVVFNRAQATAGRNG